MCYNNAYTSYSFWFAFLYSRFCLDKKIRLLLPSLPVFFFFSFLFLLLFLGCRFAPCVRYLHVHHAAFALLSLCACPLVLSSR